MCVCVCVVVFRMISSEKCLVVIHLLIHQLQLTVQGSSQSVGPHWELQYSGSILDSHVCYSVPE